MRIIEPRIPLLALSFALIGGCGAPESGSSAVAPLQAGAGGRALTGIHGRVIGKSDVSGMPDTAYGRGTVYAFKQSDLGDLARLAGQPTPDTEELQHFRPDVERKTVAEMASRETTLRTDGGYALELEPGDWVLCLADIQPHRDSSTAAQFFGCSAVSIGEVESVRLDLEFGEAGLVGRIR